MNPELKVVGLDLAKRMRKLGWDYETERWWYKMVGGCVCDTEFRGKWELRSTEMKDTIGFGEYIPAPDAIEIGERLPDKYGTYKTLNHWAVFDCVNGEINVWCFTSKTQAEALGKMWCYLKN